MGQIMQTLASGYDQKKDQAINTIINACYDKYFKNTTDWTNPDKFYRAIYQTFEELNGHIGSTQFRVPAKETLEEVFRKHHGGNGKALSKEEFNNILKDVIIKTRFTGSGGKDIFLYIFGVPVTALLIKQRVAPKAISNDILIPVVTSATVFLLAQLNKI